MEYFCPLLANEYIRDEVIIVNMTKVMTIKWYKIKIDKA